MLDYGPANGLFFNLNLKPFYFLGHCFDFLLFCHKKLYTEIIFCFLQKGGPSLRFLL